MIRPLIFALSLSVLPAFAQTTEAPETTVEPPALEQAEPPAVAQVEPAMSFDRLAQIAGALDPEMRRQGNALQLTIEDIPVLIVADPRADRMRAMIPIASADGLSPEDLMRMMQANFDSALDARYAVANGRLWAAYIHPLSLLKKDQFLSGIVQTINVARTYGNAYSGGGAIFGGGDTNGIYRELFEELKKKGEAL